MNNSTKEDIYFISLFVIVGLVETRMMTIVKLKRLHRIFKNSYLPSVFVLRFY